MTPEDRALVELILRRVGILNPDMALAYARVIRKLKGLLSLEEIERRIASGAFDQMFTQLEWNSALTPLEDQIQRTVERAFELAAKDIPGVVVGGASANVHFDVLNPRVTHAISELQTRTLDTLKQSVQSTVRETIGRRLLLGEHPHAIAIELRDVIGLAPHQERWVLNYEQQLRNGDANALKRQLVQDRTSESLLKILQSGKTIPEARIQKAVEAYRKAVIAHNSAVNTTAATLDSYRLAQYESYASAIDRGIIPQDEAEKVWIHFDPQDHPRIDHQEWGGTIVGFYEPFQDGQQVAGLGYYGCHCTTRYQLRKRHIFPQPLAA